jgi:hypothetical protein
MKASREFENFDRAIRELLKVPHTEIAAKLEQEKVQKAKKRERKTKHDRKNSD